LIGHHVFVVIESRVGALSILIRVHLDLVQVFVNLWLEILLDKRTSLIGCQFVSQSQQQFVFFALRALTKFS
jgi:hypothetical protein